MKHVPTLFPALLATLAIGAAPLADGGEAPAINNLGLASNVVQVDGGFALFHVSETGQGSIDLNGDGDALDEVLHVHDAVTATTTNLALAGMSAVALDGGYVAFPVSETQQGGTELSGDGDTLDDVFHLHDLVAGTTINLGVCGITSKFVEGVLVLEVIESQQGQDLNGDGDLMDNVVHAYDPSAATMLNTGLAAYTWSCAITQGYLALSVTEFSQGLDLNGDGDTLDSVLHVVHLASGTVQNLGVASYGVISVGPGLAFAISELSQGAIDLNGDADALDEVLHLYDPVAATAPVNLGLATYVPMFADLVGRLVFVVSEFAQGSTDLNGDGDASDTVLHVHDPAKSTTTNLAIDALMGEQGPVVDGTRIAFSVSEANQGGTDLNGDGDILDFVLHVYDANSQAVVNVGIASWACIWHGNLLAFSADEFGEGVDLNGDGDALDFVVHVFDLAFGTTVNIGLASGWLPESEAAFSVSEPGQGVDYNNDGDMLDSVPFAHDPATGATTNLGIAGALTGFWSVGAWDETLFGLTLSEWGEGADLNGDGDTGDNVAAIHAPDHARGLSSDTDFVSVGAGGRHTLRLDGGHGVGGDLYWVVGTFSGTSPGTFVGGVLLPVNPDVYFFVTVNKPNQPPLEQTFASLDAMGTAEAAVALPAGSNPVLIGVTAHHTYGAIDPLTLVVDLVSNPMPLQLIP